LNYVNANQPNIIPEYHHDGMMPTYEPTKRQNVMVSNDVNALHSVFKRHLNAKLSPDPNVVDDFTQFVKS
jgi:hypothetical protein